MRQLGIVGAGGRSEIPRFDQSHFQAAQAGVARGEAAGGAAADDQKIECFAGQSGKGALHAREG